MMETNTTTAPSIVTTTKLPQVVSSKATLSVGSKATTATEPPQLISYGTAEESPVSYEPPVEIPKSNEPPVKYTNQDIVEEDSEFTPGFTSDISYASPVEEYSGLTTESVPDILYEPPITTNVIDDKVSPIENPKSEILGLTAGSTLGTLYEPSAENTNTNVVEEALGLITGSRTSNESPAVNTNPIVVEEDVPGVTTGLSSGTLYDSYSGGSYYEPLSENKEASTPTAGFPTSDTLYAENFIPNDVEETPAIQDLH